MKCITLWEPYASLMMAGVKTNETRSWPTSHRGPLLIHAAKRWTKEQASICVDLKVNGVPDPFPVLGSRGCILGVVNVTGVITSGEWIAQLWKCKVEDAQKKKNEFFCGDYRPGRFAWATDGKPVVFDRPVPFRGAQRLYNVPTYTFAWGNNARRAELKGQRCIIAAHLKKNSVAVAMLDTGNIECVSRNALRKER